LRRGFVVAVLYNLQRSTADIDVVEVVPSVALGPLLEAAGRNSELARKHGVYIDAGGRVATLPESYADRLTELFPATFTNIKLLPSTHTTSRCRSSNAISIEIEKMCCYLLTRPPSTWQH
jgi:hypothetical protein